MSAKAVAGTADLREVVTAVTNAEVTLQTALASATRSCRPTRKSSRCRSDPMTPADVIDVGREP